MVDVAEGQEMQRLRRIITDGLGNSEWELAEIRSTEKREMLGVFRKKKTQSDG